MTNHTKIGTCPHCGAPEVDAIRPQIHDAVQVAYTRAWTRARSYPSADEVISAVMKVIENAHN